MMRSVGVVVERAKMRSRRQSPLVMMLVMVVRMILMVRMMRVVWVVGRMWEPVVVVVPQITTHIRVARSARCCC